MEQTVSKTGPEREPFLRRMVSFKDCDAFGMLYNTRYLDYVMDARVEQMIKFYDMDFYRDCRKTKESWVVQTHKISYLEPARIHEEIFIRTRTVNVGKNSLVWEGLVFDKDERRLKYVQWTKLIYVSLTSAAAQDYTPEMVEFLNQVKVVEDVPESMDFDARVKALRLRYSGA